MKTEEDKERYYEIGTAEKWKGKWFKIPAIPTDSNLDKWLFPLRLIRKHYPDFFAQLIVELLVGDWIELADTAERYIRRKR